MNFKNRCKTGLGLLMAAGMLLSFQSCNEDDVDGAPAISNVRLLDPTKADSSLNGASPGSLIVIQGNYPQVLLPTDSSSSSIISSNPGKRGNTRLPLLPMERNIFILSSPGIRLNIPPPVTKPTAGRQR